MSRAILLVLALLVGAPAQSARADELSREREDALYGAMREAVVAVVLDDGQTLARLADEVSRGYLLRLRDLTLHGSAAQMFGGTSSAACYAIVDGVLALAMRSRYSAPELQRMSDEAWTARMYEAALLPLYAYISPLSELRGYVSSEQEFREIWPLSPDFFRDTGASISSDGGEAVVRFAEMDDDSWTWALALMHADNPVALHTRHDPLKRTAVVEGGEWRLNLMSLYIVPGFELGYFIELLEPVGDETSGGEESRLRRILDRLQTEFGSVYGPDFDISSLLEPPAGPHPTANPSCPPRPTPREAGE